MIGLREKARPQQLTLTSPLRSLHHLQNNTARLAVRRCFPHALPVSHLRLSVNIVQHISSWSTALTPCPNTPSHRLLILSFTHIFSLFGNIYLGFYPQLFAHLFRLSPPCFLVFSSKLPPNVFFFLNLKFPAGSER